MLQEVLLPRLGQTMEEGTIAKWHKSEGDTVRRGEILYELTTDKATLEVESFAEGVLKKILVAEGQTVAVNELIAIIGAEGDELPDDLEAYRAQVTGAAREEAGEREPPTPPAEAKLGPAAPQPAPAVSAEVPTAARPVGRIFASPRARKLAREQKVPLAALQGSGPNSRIVERDVMQYLQRLDTIRFTPAARDAAFQAGVSLLEVAPAEAHGRISKADVEAAAARGRAAAPGPGERVPLSVMRRTIAKRMTASKQAVPHFYLVGEVLMRKALERRAELNRSGELHITITDLLVRAAALALREFPGLNARFEGDAIVLNPEANVGVAVAVEDGLFVPVIRNADTKGLPQISAELKALVQTARKGKLRPDQYEGGSLTISNLGTFGVDYFMPIINPPESCILGIGRVAEQIVVQDGAMRIEPVMKVTLSADHRVTNGAEAAQFYAAFRRELEDPQRL